jgi:hypothetical protein
MGEGVSAAALRINFSEKRSEYGKEKGIEGKLILL